VHHQKGSIVAAKAKSPDEARAQQAKKDAAAAAAIAKKNKNKTAFDSVFGTNSINQVAFDQYGNLIFQQTVFDNNGKPTGEFRPVYINVSAGGKTVGDPIDATTAVANIKKSYGKNLESLRKSLYERGYMSERDYVTRSEAALNGAILKSAMEHSVEMVQRYTVNGVTNFNDYTSWLSGKPAYTSGAGGGPDTRKISTPKSETDQDINKFFFDMLGRLATENEKTQYFNAVQAAEKNAYSKSTIKGSVQTDVNTLLTQDDYYRIMANILRPSVIGTPLEKITQGTGKIAQSVATLKEYSASYGVARTAQETLNDVLEGMKVGGTLTTGELDQQKAKIRNLAKARYSNLSNLIDEGLKVSDIANQFAYYKSKILEMPENAISIFDDDIQAALDNRDANGKSQPGVMGIGDYQMLLRKSPKTREKWLRTGAAREEASGYALSILRSFGLMG